MCNETTIVSRYNTYNVDQALNCFYAYNETTIISY